MRSAVGFVIAAAALSGACRDAADRSGGNNAAVVMHDADLRQAAIEIVRCAFNTTGQRCTCTRRAIIHVNIADKQGATPLQHARRRGYVEIARILENAGAR